VVSGKRYPPETLISISIFHVFLDTKIRAESDKTRRDKNDYMAVSRFFLIVSGKALKHHLLRFG